MVESTSPRQPEEEVKEQQSLMQYFHNQVSDIPQPFVQQFVTNYIHRDTWVRSDYLFEWFAVISPNYRYDDYHKKLRKIVKESELKDFQEATPGIKGRRKIYLISQKGMKFFMLSVSSDVRESYAALEDHLFNYLDYQRKCIENRIQIMNDEYQDPNIGAEVKGKHIKGQQYIYIVRCDDNDYIKVGLSTNLDSRLQNYKTSHWSVQLLRDYIVQDEINLREAEIAIHSFMSTIYLSRHKEMFKFNISEIDQIVDQADKFMGYYLKNQADMLLTPDNTDSV